MHTLTQEDIENMAVETADKIERRSAIRTITIRAERRTFPMINISTRLVVLRMTLSRWNLQNTAIMPKAALYFRVIGKSRLKPR